MNIVFFVDNYYPQTDANTLVVESICDYFSQEGHCVYIMPANFNGALKQEEIYKGTNIIRLLPSDTKKAMKNEIKNMRFIMATKIFSVLIASKIFGSHTLKNKKSYIATHFIEKWLLNANVDLAISVNCSIENSFPLLRLKKKSKLPCKWIFYMIDPFASHEYYLKYNRERKLQILQHEIMEACDRICATNVIYKDTAKWETQEILNKIRITEFPKITKTDISEEQESHKWFDDGVNVLCTGTKNEQVRNSEYTLSLCRRIKNVTFHFIGIGWAEKEIVRQGNLIFYPPSEHDQILCMQSQADFLLNIGNRVTNQLPSKVLEYICMGKPIINIYKCDECPTLSILQGWDCLNIREDSDLIDVEMILENYLKLSHYRLPFSEIETKYSEYTPEKVGKNFFI